MESINAEWDVIRLLENELNNRKEDKFKHQLKRLKNLAYAIDLAISVGGDGYDIHRATNILCKYLGILWRNVFNVND